MSCECGWKIKEFRDPFMTRKIISQHKKNCLVFYTVPEQPDSDLFAVTKDGKSKLYHEGDGVKLETDMEHIGQKLTVTVVDEHGIMKND